MNKLRILGTALATVALSALLAGAADAKVVITNEPNCKIKIALYLEFHGEGVTDSLIDVWKADIVSKWSGLKDKSGWCDVIIEVNTKKRASSDPATAGYDQVKVVKSPDSKHISWSQNGGVGTDRECEWDDHDSGSVAAHECGHLMGLDNGCEEGYEVKTADNDNTKRKTEPKPGREKSIMGAASCDQKGIQWDIEKILEKAGISCPDTCCAGKGSSTTTGTPTTTPPVQEKPKEPGTTTFTDDGTLPHVFDVTLPDAMGGGNLLINNFQGNFVVDYGFALVPEADCLADSNLVPIAIRSLLFTAPSVLLPGGQQTGPNTMTLWQEPDPYWPWASTGRLNWATRQFEMVLATALVNDLFPPAMPLPNVGVVTGTYDPLTGQASYESAQWMLGDAATGIEDRLRDGLDALVPSMLVAPSPARHKAIVAFSLPRGGMATLDVYDVRGRRVRRLEERELRPGTHIASWDLLDDAGRRVPAGIYIYRLTAGDRTLIRKSVVVR